MVTKDELDQLRNNHPKLNKELHYTIEGAVETAVHSTLDAERTGQLDKGDRLMNEAANHFEHNMAFKARKGQAKSQFDNQAQHVPLQDQQIAESTWATNAINAHTQSLNKASHDFRTSMQSAAHNQIKPVDTDLGYGAGTPHPIVDQHLQSKSVTAFKEAMNNKSQNQLLDKDR